MTRITSRVVHEDGTVTTTTSDHPGHELVLTDDGPALVPDDTLCRYTFDGTDTDGTEWYLCTVHDELAIGDETACAANPGDEDGRRYVDPDHVTIGKPEPFTDETWLLFDDEDDEDPSHTACITQADGDYRVSWWHEDVGLVTDVDFDTLEAAHAFLEHAGYRDYTA